MSNRCTILLFVFSGLAALVRPVHAQAFPGLPSIDAFNASGQIGTIAPSTTPTVPKTRLDKFDLWGWGVEAEFDLPLNPAWEGTLGLGYNQLNLNADIYAGRRLQGTLRDLPALSVYLGRKTAHAYVGATLAVSELVNGRLYRAPDPGVTDPGPIKLSASAYSVGVAAGYEVNHFFVELGYLGRYFPSLAFDGLPMGGFPADLGSRMYSGGFMLRVGGRLRVKSTSPKPKTIDCDGTTGQITLASHMKVEQHCAKGILTLNTYENPKDPKDPKDSKGVGPSPQSADQYQGD